MSLRLALTPDVARILLDTRISGVPVVGTDGKLLGIVSEGDLMRRVEVGTGRKQPWWLVMLTDRGVLASEFVKEHSRKVADVMTRSVITAATDTPLSTIANMLEKNAIKRVPDRARRQGRGHRQPREPLAGTRQPEQAGGSRHPG
jgi:CBS domain-containing protein